MAKLIDGINGMFSGKVGNVVGVNSKKKPHMRSAPKKSSVPPSAAQLSYRKKFGLVSRFLAPIASIQEEWFSQPVEMKSRRNLAQSYHVSHAVLGNYPDFSINYEKALITNGDLAGVSGLSASRAPGNKIAFTWEDNSSAAMASLEDLFLVAVYHAETNEFAFESTALRQSGDFIMELPAEWNEQPLHCWVSFLNQKNGVASNSSYVGVVDPVPSDDLAIMSGGESKAPEVSRNSGGSKDAGPKAGVLSSSSLLNKNAVIFFWTENLESHLVAAHTKILEMKKRHPRYTFIAINVDRNHAKWSKQLANYRFGDIQQYQAADFDDLRSKWAIYKIHRTMLTHPNGVIDNAFVSLFEANFEKHLK